jgi:hypothetical protein
VLEGVAGQLAICPAISTPVGPPPTTTNVIAARCASRSRQSSARSKAPSSLDRTASALSSDFTSPAISAHSGLPK